MGILECKIKNETLDFLMGSRCVGLSQYNNFGEHSAGHILVLWSSRAIEVDVVGILSQLIHLRVTCKITSQVFLVTFIYSFNTIVARRDLWNQLRRYELGHIQPWLVVGDFNSILRGEKKRNGSLSLRTK